MSPRAEVGSIAGNYAGLRLLSAPAVLLTYTAVGWFIGRHDTRWPMLILITTNLVNIVLDAVLILGFGLASTGAALATVSAEYVGLALAITGLLRSGLPVLSSSARARILDLAGLRSVLRSNAELFVRTLTLLFAFAFFTAAGEQLGTQVVAANAIMMQFLLFSAFALDGFAYAAEGLAGEALGRGDPAAFHHVTRRCALWSGAAAMVISGVILLGRPVLFPLLTDLPGVAAVMAAQGLWLVIMPMASAPSYLLDGVFVGAGATRAMMVTMVGSALGVYLPVWYVTQGMGNDGL
jgi:multidrug resistance protein, MATE family